MTASDIKFAKPEDIPQIVAFGYKSFEENTLPGAPNFDKALIHITNLVISGIVLVKRNTLNSKLIDGVIVLQQGQPWFSDIELLTTLLFYIKPEARSFKLAKDLVSSAKEYAIMNRLPIVFDLFAQKDVEKKKKLIKYLGFKDFGSSLIFLP